MGKVGPTSVVVRTWIIEGQLAFFEFQYEISKCGSLGHEIMVRKQCMA